MSVTNAPEMEILDTQHATARCQARMRVRREHLPGADGLDTSTTAPQALTRSKAVKNPVSGYREPDVRGDVGAREARLRIQPGSHDANWPRTTSGLSST
jgi:hypothetical protein